MIIIFDSESMAAPEIAIQVDKKGVLKYSSIE